jgi:heat shock protein HtpX
MMKWVGRIVLFLLVNLLVVTMVTLILELLHVRPFLHAHGIDLGALLVFCLVWGMVGAMTSLALSRPIAKWITGLRLITSVSQDPQERRLIALVKELASKAGLPMPQVGIFSSQDANAFATGPTRSRSLVAVSSALLQRMNEEELRGVLAHELSHIENGDMVTMALLQGIVNAFVMFLARALAYFFSGASRGRSQEGGSSTTSYILWVYLFQFGFMILGSLVVAAFSRFREFRADRGGARLGGKSAMIQALAALQNLHQGKRLSLQQKEDALAAFKIHSQEGRSSLRSWFSTHPPIEERIQRLKALR